MKYKKELGVLLIFLGFPWPVFDILDSSYTPTQVILTVIFFVYCVRIAIKSVKEWHIGKYAVIGYKSLKTPINRDLKGIGGIVFLWVKRAYHPNVLSTLFFTQIYAFFCFLKINSYCSYLLVNFHLN